MKLFFILIAILLLGCGTDDTETGYSIENCNTQIDQMLAREGSSEDVNTYDSPDYHSHDFWYWCKGTQHSFTWGNNVDGCEVSKHTFSPVCAE